MRAATIPEEPRRSRGRKDRKRWCGGHAGREHSPRFVPFDQWCQRTDTPQARTQLEERRKRAAESNWRPGIAGVRVCAVCGKTLEFVGREGA